MRGFSPIRRAGAAAVIAMVCGGAIPLLVLTPAYGTSRQLPGVSLTVSPSTVVAGGTVTFSGSIPAGSCDAVTITSGPDLFPPDGFGPQAPVNSAGHFQINFRVPTSTSPGTKHVGGRACGGNIGVGATFQVTSQVGVVPSGAPQAGLGGASRGSDPSGWIAAGLIATIVAGLVGSIAALRWRRSQA